MRLALALIVACLPSACGYQPSGSGGMLVGASRSAQAALDAEAIMRGMEQARNSEQRLARDTRQQQTLPEQPPPSLTR